MSKLESRGSVDLSLTQSRLKITASTTKCVHILLPFLRERGLCVHYGLYTANAEEVYESEQIETVCVLHKKL